MGRCQGGFCQPYVAELIAKEYGIPFEEVTKNGEGSNLVVGVSK
jgi:glycerol-3-phosphate dehydrogenase